MAKKRPVAIVVLGIFGISMGLLALLSFFNLVSHLHEITDSPKGPTFFALMLVPVVAVFWIPAGIGILMLKKWAKNLFIAVTAMRFLLAIVQLLVGLYKNVSLYAIVMVGISYLVYAYIIYYFTRPNAKELFG
ncbi:MAG: hypothetical protein PHP17_04060 [Candidatus Omnitrophica bacterium]|nr:hypothetical protein [Candidatus Omnitrophota bacterium]